MDRWSFFTDSAWFTKDKQDVMDLGETSAGYPNSAPGEGTLGNNCRAQKRVCLSPFVGNLKHFHSGDLSMNYQRAHIANALTENELLP